MRGIERMILKLYAVCQEWHVRDHVYFGMSLALEEVVGNIIDYGLNSDEENLISIRFVLDENVFEVEIIDEAPLFNPLDFPDPDDANNSEANRRISEIGVDLINKFTDDFTYTRSNDKNIVTITKKLETYCVG